MINAFSSGFCNSAMGIPDDPFTLSAEQGNNRVVVVCKESQSRTIVDTGKSAAEAIGYAKDRNWPGAAIKSYEVGQDLTSGAQATGEAFIQSRTDAVNGGYSQNSDVGFQ